MNIKTKIEREYFGIDSLDHKIMFGIFSVHHRVREDSTETLNWLDVHLNVVEKFNLSSPVNVMVHPKVHSKKKTFKS